MAEKGFLPMRRSKTYAARHCGSGLFWWPRWLAVAFERAATLPALPMCSRFAPLLPQRGQHAGCGQLSGHFVHWRVAAPQDRARSGGNTSGGNHVGTPFGVKMFSEGALIVGFSDLNTPDGTANPAKKAGLRLGDRVVRMDDTPDRDERCRARCSGNGRRRTGAGGLYPQW